MILYLSLKKNFSFVLKFEDEKQLRFSCRKYRDYTFLNTAIGTLMLHIDINNFFEWIDGDVPYLYVDNGLSTFRYNSFPTLIKIRKEK